MHLGYWWEFSKEAESKDPEDEAKKAKKKTSKEKAKEETGSAFQRQRVNYLLEELVKKFPFKAIPPPTQIGQQTQSDQRSTTEEPQKEIKVEIKTEPGTKPPPEKKPRLV